MATIEKRRASDGTVVYRVKIRLHGHPSETATFQHITKAKLWVQQTESAIRDGRYFKTSKARKHTLEQMIDRYKKDILPSKSRNAQHAKNQAAQLDWWKSEIGVYTLADMTPTLIAETRDKLAAREVAKDKKLSPSTVVRYMAALSHAFTIAVKEWGWLDDSPMRKVAKPKEPRGRVRFLSDDERKALLDACKGSATEYLYPVVILALSTGMRQSEIMSLTWDDVDLNRNCIILQKTKNDERRNVPLAGHAYEVIKQLSKVRAVHTKLLFPGINVKQRQRPFNLRKPWLNAIEAAGLSDFRFHDLRHSAASYLAMNGATLAEIAEVLGHKTLQMVKRYAHLSEAHTSKVVAAMNKKIFG